MFGVCGQRERPVPAERSAMTYDDDALGLLQREDLELRRLFGEVQVQEATADTVHGRAVYGDLAKDIIQHLATREAALTAVARTIAHMPEFETVAVELDADSSNRRQLLDRLEKMSRGVQGINLNTGQDFDAVLQRLMETVEPEIDRDLGKVTPAMRAWLSQPGHDDPFKSAGYVTWHAPTSLSPTGPRWYERAPVISRLLTVYDKMRDFPRALRHR